ncbi:hypothetical protein BH10ACI2_BH10ACI2_19190 [soil metagenome]
MKFLYAISLLFVVVVSASPQKLEDVLATATGHTFRVSDLSPDTQKDIADLPSALPKARSGVLDQMVSQRVYEAEAKSRGITMGKLITDEKAKVANPTEAEIKTVIDANQDKLAGLPADEIRKRVIAYLRSGPEQKALIDFSGELKTKYKVIAGKDVNAPNLAPTDVVVTINGNPVTAKVFEDYARLPIYDATADMADSVLGELNELIYNALILDEAKSLSIDAGELIGREVTNKMKDYSQEERLSLEDTFKEKLYTKYQVKILYKEPAAPVQNVSLGSSPSKGPATAPVTIVMFSDFQCSACSATHPILKKAIAAYPGKIRFVVRDFPLESIHEHAFRAALAAGAANVQGKFFEYTEILYTHQDALDDASLKKYAADLGLNAKQFEIDFNSEKTAAEVRKDMDDGIAYGINSTPTIFVNGVMVRNISAAGFKMAIDRALRK